MMKSEIKRNYVKNKNHIYIHKTSSNKNKDKINLLYQIIFIQCLSFSSNCQFIIEYNY